MWLVLFCVLVRVLQRNKANSIKFMYIYKDTWGFPGGSVVKNPPANAGDAGSVPGFGRSPGGRNGNWLQYSCLQKLMGRGAWQATAHWVAKSWTRLTRLSTHRCATLCLVAQSCPTLCDLLDCSPPGSSFHGDSSGKSSGVGCNALLQRIFPTEDLSQVFHIAGRLLTIWTTREAQEYWSG